LIEIIERLEIAGRAIAVNGLVQLGLSLDYEMAG
jgi:hypothetical protein